MEKISAGVQLYQALQPDPALHNEIFKLRVALPMSDVLIERSECWRFKYKVIDDLLPQLKDATYDAQNILNEYTYQESKKRVEDEKMRFPGQLVSSSLTNFRNWISGYTTGVREVQDRLDYACGKLKEACDELLIPQKPDKFSETARPITSSSIAEPKVFGRDKEVNEVMHLLGIPETNISSRSRKRAREAKMLDLAKSSSVENKGNVSVLPIVGIGGVGKTTLAQMVCNKREVNPHFELIIWVCVSDDFNVARLTKEIIEGATKNTCDINNLSSLQATLKETLKSKRFLVVLDDIWSESRSDWRRLFGTLNEGCEGSTIIVTTRSRKVAEIVGTITMGPITLEGLEERVYWDFFSSCAFGLDTNSENYPELEDIGKQIVVKLKGSPLAAKTLGSLLSADLNVWHWRNIRDSEMWELQQEEDGILPALQLSYQYLPSHLKKCFSFCSLYPKDYKFSESELIWFWVQKGFITAQHILGMFAVGRGYIRDLVNRYFFQKFANMFNVEYYIIHDLMHGVSQSITKDECFRIENENFEQKISIDIRHMSVFRASYIELEKLHRYKKMQSLTIHLDYEYSFTDSLSNALTNSICSLSLANCKVKKLPKSIGNLKHLRYLDVSRTQIDELPDSLCNLYNLEVLNMMGLKIKCFPEGSYKLISLKVFLWDKPELVCHIPNLVKAMQCKRIMFYVNLDKNFNITNNGSNIEMLEHVNGAYGHLRIDGLKNVSNMGEAQKAQLNKKEFVESMDLNFSGCDNYKDNQPDVLEGLCPHPNLKALYIYNYEWESLHPSWLEPEFLTNLIEILICNCTIVTVSHLPRCITSLMFIECPRLKSLQNCLVPENLPSLTRITIQKCGELELLPVETFDGFIFLEKLIITECPKLNCPRQLVLPPSICKLEMESCGGLEESFPS